MHQPNQRVLLRNGVLLLPILLGSSLCPPAARCQTNVGGGLTRRGFQIEIDVTIRDGTRDILAVPANVKLYCNGTPCEEGSASNGRIRFIMNGIGDFTITVQAPGYKLGQKEVKVSEPDKVQVEVNMERDPSSSFKPATAGDPILAPKAREALDKGMQALRDGKLDEAEKALDQAMQLAPNNPNVLYMQGVLNLKKHEWTKAQSVLEKATQIDPNSARALAALGMALCNQRKYAEAIPPLEKSVQLDSASGWETHWSLAESYYHSARFDEALKASQQAQTESNGQVPHVALLVAQALTAVGRYEDSATVLRELLKNHGDGAEAVTARRYLERLTANGKIRQQ
ncbi:MAG TPA: tetratricopeptide repeat protein [Candidatus Acidoferrum sp.]|nr:tetratricopeptide repeat protein [Candidatus Acidoferrum sp.]